MASTMTHDTERTDPAPPPRREGAPADRHVVSDTTRRGNARSRRGVARSAMSDSIGLYLNEIGKVPLLTADEEKELSRVIEAGREAERRLEAGEQGP